MNLFHISRLKHEFSKPSQISLWLTRITAFTLCHGRKAWFQKGEWSGPIKSINCKVNDLKYSSNSYRNFERFRNRFLYSPRQYRYWMAWPDYTPVLCLENEDTTSQNRPSNPTIKFAYSKLIIKSRKQSRKPAKTLISPFVNTL